MSLTMANVDVKDDWVGTRDIKLDGLMIQGDELTIRGCELLSKLIKQSIKGDWDCYNVLLSLSNRPPSYGRPLTLYSSLWTILVLHLLVIQAYTWVHVPSVTPFDVLWVAMTQITLFRGHVHINGARMLAVVFNVEVTVYPGIASPLYSHGYLIALALSFGTLWETALSGVPLSPSAISVCREQDCPQQRLLAVWTFFVRPRTFLPPRRGPWAWYEMGQGCQILWPHKCHLVKWRELTNFVCILVLSKNRIK